MSTRPTPILGPDLRSALVAMVRKRVPESEVEDIVQAAMAEAIESPHAPSDQESLRRSIFGVAKNKVVDFHRRAGRERFELPEVPDDPAPHVEADLLRWAERNLPPGTEAQKTLDWMLREGDGEKLESIAETEDLPAPRVRQRVSRLRRHLKEHWAKEAALLAALGVLVAVAVVVYLRRPDRPEPIANDPKLQPLDNGGARMRQKALERCAAGAWQECVEGLDEAKGLDPAGDALPEVQEARAAAGRALRLPPVPSAEPLAPPSKPEGKPQGRPESTGMPSATPPMPPPPMPSKPQGDSMSTPFDSDPGGSGGSEMKVGPKSGVTKSVGKPAAKAPAPAYDPKLDEQKAIERKKSDTPMPKGPAKKKVGGGTS